MRLIALALTLAAAMLAISVVLPGTPAPTLPPLPPPGTSRLTRVQAVESATGSVTARAAAKLMDYRSATVLLRESAQPGIDPSLEVWVVTLTRPTPITVILDSTTGTVIGSCVGCHAL